MFVAAADLAPDATIRADIAIAGGGAAGITLARALRNRGLRVAVIESGGFEFDPAAQGLYEGTTSGSDYDLAGSRLRYFGGTTNHWGGWTRPLDPVDFAARPWIPHSGWPLDRAALDPYYGPAVELALRIDADTYDWEFWRDERDVTPLAETDTLTGAIYRINATRFGEVYRDDLKTADDVTVYLGLNVVSVALDAAGARVSTFDAATLDGRRVRVEASAYVVALGGIENARLLLASRDRSAAGVGNEHDLVGRYFSDHIESIVGTLVTTVPVSGAYLPGRLDIVRAALTFTPQALREHELGNVAFVLAESAPPGSEALVGDIPAAHVAEVLDAIEGGTATAYSLQIRAEPEPNPESRITLTDDVDALGMPRVDVHRVLTDADHRRLREAVELLATELGRAGAGWVRVDDDGLAEDTLFYGFHHIGTTRMSTDPRRGVVDPDGRVHGVGNLWIAGSSVFPAAGYANPTLTIVALALRLADHLGEQLR